MPTTVAVPVAEAVLVPVSSPAVGSCDAVLLDADVVAAAADASEPAVYHTSSQCNKTRPREK